ncbi:Ezrin/radixin/moesin family protein [Fulvivirga maritima]|uniref:Ezrin/radixin/moesin family protein n=1 Tax=Fulvivirga maritima TaxID=2904247 RepID=UPI001F31FD90|nr:Ezrin/radixin/moesin family protein [Fulvivirga maritima]UII28454.1 Ezrin/radixin/moesin family protein [Fulvivirga maritima]
MKRITALLTLVLAVAWVTSSYAQLSKDEAKEWKNKAKEYKKNPEELKQLVEEKESLEGEVSSLKNENTGLQSRVSDQNAKISELQEDMSKLRNDLASARAELRDAQASPATAAPSSDGKMVDGVVFKVQVGAFRNKDLSKYFDNNENFSGESEDGMQKITLGQFRDYWEADTFKKYLREMGVKDAWIVPYKDGTRVDIKDVLEGVIASGGPSDSE